VTLLTAIDPKNIIDLSDHDDRTAAADTPPMSSVPTSSYSFRKRKASQSKLVYDGKYHPMDDSIRPSQAAKRRSAHGEIESFSDENKSDSFTVHADSDIEAESNEHVEGVETEKKPRSAGKSKKRTQGPTRSPEPTRRSSRRTAVSKVAYNMNIHPQDNDLEVSSSNDEGEASPPTVKRKKLLCPAANKSITHQHGSNAHSSEDPTKVTSVIDIDSDAADGDDSPTCSSREGCLPEEDTSSADKQGMSIVDISHSFRYCASEKIRTHADFSISYSHQDFIAAVVCPYSSPTWYSP
jgi:hypothetical protein